MQTIDGDQFILDKESVILLYCNKNKWGDAENHYDLMYPIPQQLHKGKTYNRRSESQQMAFYKTEANHVSEKQKHTKFGEEQTEQDKSENQEFLGPKEDNKTQRE
eukprot:5589168-Heterocapsa_arctica.AAC.1